MKVLTGTVELDIRSYVDCILDDSSDGLVKRIKSRSREPAVVVTPSLDRYRIVVSVVVTCRYLAVKYPPQIRRGHASPRPLFGPVAPLTLPLSSIAATS